MNFAGDISDSAALDELGRRIAQYRLNSNMTQAALAREAGVSKRTLIRVEHGESSQTLNLIRILRALRILGNFEALIPEHAISPIQQLQLGGRARKRASPNRESSRKKEPWSWGDSE